MTDRLSRAAPPRSGDVRPEPALGPQRRAFAEALGRLLAELVLREEAEESEGPHDAA